MRLALPALASLVLGMSGIVACPAPKEPLPSNIGATPAASASPKTAGSGDNVFHCTGDAECRSKSYYCGGCSCLALAEQEPEPQCIGGSEVKCLIDPCRGQTAFCDGGRCNLRAANKP